MARPTPNATIHECSITVTSSMDTAKKERPRRGGLVVIAGAVLTLGATAGAPTHQQAPHLQGSNLAPWRFGCVVPLRSAPFE